MSIARSKLCSICSSGLQDSRMRKEGGRRGGRVIKSLFIVHNEAVYYSLNSTLHEYDSNSMRCSSYIQIERTV